MAAAVCTLQEPETPAEFCYDGSSLTGKEWQAGYTPKEFEQAGSTPKFFRSTLGLRLAPAFVHDTPRRLFLRYARRVPRIRGQALAIKNKVKKKIRQLSSPAQWELRPV